MITLQVLDKVNVQTPDQPRQRVVKGGRLPLRSPPIREEVLCGWRWTQPNAAIGKHSHRTSSGLEISLELLRQLLASQTMRVGEPEDRFSQLSVEIGKLCRG